MIAILYDAKKENMFLSFKVCMGLSREIRLLLSFVKFTHGIYMYCFHFVCIYCLEGTGVSRVYEIVGIVQSGHLFSGQILNYYYTSSILMILAI